MAVQPKRALLRNKILTSPSFIDKKTKEIKTVLALLSGNKKITIKTSHSRKSTFSIA